jgi:hypothetical protein
MLEITDRGPLSREEAARITAVTAVLDAILDDPSRHLYLSEEGQIGILIPSHLSPFRFSHDVQGEFTEEGDYLVTDQEAIASALVTGAVAYRMLQNRVASKTAEESIFAGEPVSQGGEGEHLLPVQEPGDGQLQLPGFGSGEGQPRSSSAECAVLAFDRR